MHIKYQQNWSLLSFFRKIKYAMQFTVSNWSNSKSGSYEAKLQYNLNYTIIIA